MIGAYPRRGGWVTVQLAAASSDREDLVLLELAGDCPGDPDAEPIRVTTCASPHDAHARAAARLAAGWAAHATTDRAVGPAQLAAALRAPAWTPPTTPPDRPLPDRDAVAAVAHAAACRPERFCLFPNPTARHRPARHQ
jgi:hypothetical protein